MSVVPAEGSPARAASRPAVLAVALVVLVSVILVAVLNPGLVRFWPMSAAEFLQTMAPVVLVSLILERALEVFVTASRGPTAAAAETALVKAARDLDGAVKALEAAERPAEGRAPPPDAVVAAARGARDEKQAALAAARSAVSEHRSKTQRNAFLGGLALGVVVSALGVRILGLFVDPAVFGSLPAAQQGWFNAADVVLSGAVLGGGADGLHKLVSVFTNYLDTVTQGQRSQRALRAP